MPVSFPVGTGFAIAAGLANPNKEVLCYYGDGSFGMTEFDMETANRFGLPYLAAIGNNSAMNQIAAALQRGRESIAKTGRSAVINICVDPREYARGTQNQTMYK